LNVAKFLFQRWKADRLAMAHQSEARAAGIRCEEAPMQTVTSPPGPSALSHAQIRIMLQDAEGLAAAMRRQLVKRPKSLLSRVRSLAFLFHASLMKRCVSLGAPAWVD